MTSFQKPLDGGLTITIVERTCKYVIANASTFF
jgi:hypothetical protein